MSATALNHLLAGARHSIGKRPRGRSLGAEVVPEFLPQRNSAPPADSSQTTNDATFLEVGPQEIAD